MRRIKLHPTVIIKGRLSCTTEEGIEIECRNVVSMLLIHERLTNRLGECGRDIIKNILGEICRNKKKSIELGKNIV